MVGILSHPEEFFIYGNKDKLWIVMDDGIFEFNEYVVSSFMYTINRSPNMLNFSDGLKLPVNTAVDSKMNIEIIPLDVSYRLKEQTDISDFYNIEECKKLSKVIQRKFDKILEDK